MSKPLPWSFSALNTFVGCPHKYCETKVLKHFKDEPGEAALWGTYVHKCIEDWYNESKEFPENVKIYVPQILDAFGLYGHIDLVVAEHKLALDPQFQPCKWLAPAVFVRGIIDLLKIDGPEAWAIDWKLGKIKPDSKQLKLFALLVFYRYPNVNTVHTSFEWLQFNKQTQETFTRDQIPELWRVFVGDLTQYVQAFKDDVWQKRPSGLCRDWCPVKSCEHNGAWTGRKIKEIK